MEAISNIFVIGLEAEFSLIPAWNIIIINNNISDFAITRDLNESQTKISKFWEFSRIRLE